MKRNTTKKEKRVFGYLNKLRESGATNMFGAIPYMQKVFPAMNFEEAKSLLLLWMKNFNPDGNYETIETKEVEA